MRKEFGFLTVAFGKQKYLDQAKILALSIKKHMPDIPVAIATDQPAAADVFDDVVPIDLSRGGSFMQKIWLDDYSPYERTLFIDSDCIVGEPFYDQIERLKSFTFTPVCERYLVSGDRDEDGWVKDIGKALEMVGGHRYPKFNGGVYYFDRSEEAQKVFAKSREIARDADRFGLQNPSGGVAGDETIFALALAALGVEPLYNDHGRLMRTPIGATGSLSRSGRKGFSFKKYGETVEPAICHFAGPYVNTFTYKHYSAALKGDDVGLLWKLKSYAAYPVFGAPVYMRRLKAGLKAML